MKSLLGQATEPSTLPVSRARKMTRKVEAIAEALPLDRLQPEGQLRPPCSRRSAGGPGAMVAT